MEVANEPRSTTGEWRNSLSTVSLSELADACRDESARFRAGSTGDGAYGMELFRRAICQRDEGAWQLLLELYRGLLLAHLKRHPYRDLVREEPDVWINHAWARFWTAVPADRFGSFPNLACTLRYLKMCLHSVVMDAARANRRLGQEPLAAAEQHGATEPMLEETVLGSVAGAELWKAIVAELDGDQERLVAWLSFVRGLKPNEVHARRPEQFHDVTEVYRIKRNIVERLRRRFSGDR